MFSNLAMMFTMSEGALLIPFKRSRIKPLKGLHCIVVWAWCILALFLSTYCKSRKQMLVEEESDNSSGRVE